MKRKPKLIVAVVFAIVSSTMAAPVSGSALDNPKFLDIDGLDIAYYESEGTRGPGILLIHGNSSSAKIFKEQLDGKLGDKFRVVALDLPGHGNSDYALDPAAVYKVPGYVDAVVALAEHLDLTSGVFVGWSLGGSILLEATLQLPDAAGFLIFGTGPAAKPFDPDAFLEGPAGPLGLQADLSEEEVIIYGTAFFKPGATEIPMFIFDDIIDTDPLARQFLGISLFLGEYEDEVVILENLSRLTAILHGLQDQFINLAFIQNITIPALWRGEVQTIDQAGHAVQLEQPKTFDKLVKQFVNFARTH